MIKHLPVQVSSIKLVEEELNNTIQKASGYFEAFLADRNTEKTLQDCSTELIQIRGTLELVQLPGAVELTAEMLKLIGEMAKNKSLINDSALSALSHAFVALPCYIEYCSVRQTALPILLSDYINELRIARRAELISESAYTHFAKDYSGEMPQRADASISEDFSSLVRRLRHMYQLGLLGVIKEDNLDYTIALMLRATQRLQKISGQHALAELWWLSSGALEALSEGKLSLSLFRKRLFSSIDKQIKAVVYKGESALDTSLPIDLKTELLFLVNLAKAKGQVGPAIRQAYKLPETGLSDNDISKERQLMQGPNANTISAMVKVLKEEMSSAKEILEIAAQDIATSSGDFQHLAKVLTKVSDILSVVGLSSTSEILKQQRDKISGWSDSGEDLSTKDLLDVADALLYVESTLTGLDRLDLSDDDLSEASEISKQEVIAKSHLAEAEVVVIQEAQAGISLAKRAITSFVESNYDRVHISNVAVTLNTVRGGLALLNYDRSAAVLASCIRFVENTITEGISENNIQELLETLADALISLEYYLAELEIQANVDDKVLEIAEESLAALGYPVQISNTLA